MSIDPEMSELHDVFFEECAEGLALIEKGLLELTEGTVDIENINDIFRAAHSIKGGAGTFGFMDISHFTHGMETILDQMREGTRNATTDIIELLLQCADCIGTMIAATQSDEAFDNDVRLDLDRRIAAVLENDEGSNAANGAGATIVDSRNPVAPKECSGQSRWHIEFAPTVDILMTGNDPFYIFRELESLGTLKISADFQGVPQFQLLDPEQLYMSWTLELVSDASEQDIAEHFEWVSTQCELSITQELDNSVETGRSTSASSSKLESAELTMVKKPSSAVSSRDKKKSSNESSSIRVDIEKVDSLLNLVGELVITQSMLKRFGEHYDSSMLDDFRDGLNQLERHTRELQESAMQIRMLPIGASFARFPRLVRDLSNSLGKKIQLVTSGEHTQVDKTVLENISDPLVHLVRNSMDHGIETPEVRLSQGKPEMGTLYLSAAHEGGNIVIEVSDNGAGLDRERILKKATEKGLVGEGETWSDERIDNVIFQPGFSTADKVSDVSGRGVGMDVVRRNIMLLGGHIKVDSNPGQGTKFRISLPLTLAIMDGQLVRVGEEYYVISLLSILETVKVTPEKIKHVSGEGDVYRMRDNYIRVIRATNEFGIQTNDKSDLLVIVEAENVCFGILVDELLEQHQIVVKSLERNYRKVLGMTGATILGDGRVALILDIPGLLQSLVNKGALSHKNIHHIAERLAQEHIGGEDTDGCEYIQAARA